MSYNITNGEKCHDFQQRLISHCKTFCKDVEPDWESLINITNCYSANKNTVLLRTNQYENKLRFLTKGVIKVVHEGVKTYVYDFRTKDDFLCDISSVVDNTPSKFSFITITDCEWIEVSTKILMKELKTNLFFQDLNKALMNRYLKKSQYKYTFLRINDAEKRYQIFCNEKPEVIKNAKLGDIASYLGITQQSLSRIRNSK